MRAGLSDGEPSAKTVVAESNWRPAESYSSRGALPAITNGRGRNLGSGAPLPSCAAAPRAAAHEVVSRSRLAKPTRGAEARRRLARS